MSLGRFTSGLTFARQCIIQHARRNIGVTAVISQKASADPIQQLFVDKIREYAKKSSAAGGKLVDATASVEEDLQRELNKLENQYSAAGKNMTEFPTFSFTEPKLEPAGLSIERGPDEEVVFAPSAEEEAQT